MKARLTVSLLLAASLASFAHAQTRPTIVTLRYTDDVPGESTFSRKEVWRTWNEQSQTLTAANGDGTLMLLFRAKPDGDYAVSNDLGDDPSPFAIHGFMLAPGSQLHGPTPTTVRIGGKPMLLRPVVDGEGPTISLGARDPKKGSVTFDVSNDLRFAGELNIVGEGNQNFRLSGHLTEESAGLGVKKSGASALELAGGNRWTGPTLVSKGALRLHDGESIGTGPLTIESAGIIQFVGPAPRAGLSNSLDIAAKGKLDLNGNGWVIDYSETSPIESIQNMLKDGRIVSTSLPEKLSLVCIEASTLEIPVFSQRKLDATCVIVGAVRTGDTNLDGAVDVKDLTVMKKFFNKPGTWIDGDFTQDGKIDFDDLLKMSQNYDSAQGFEADWSRLGA